VVCGFGPRNFWWMVGSKTSESIKLKLSKLWAAKTPQEKRIRLLIADEEPAILEISKSYPEEKGMRIHMMVVNVLRHTKEKTTLKMEIILTYNTKSYNTKS